MNKLTDKIWWKHAGIRAIKTVAQAAVATIGASTLVTEINWLVVGSSALMAGLLSILTSIGNLPEYSNDNSEILINPIPVDALKYAGTLYREEQNEDELRDQNKQYPTLSKLEEKYVRNKNGTDIS